MILELRGVNTFYGQSHILQDVSLDVERGEAVCLLGRNGVGKTTTLRTIMGLTPPRSGSIRFAGAEIARREAYEVSRLGIGYVPDDRRIFPDLTTFENLELARRMGGKNKARWTIDKVFELFPSLGELRNRRGLHLSGGEQKMLAIGRALMKSPQLLLLDEPSEGLAPLMVEGLLKVIGEILAEGVTILLADQNLKFCRASAQRGYIMERGRIQYHGSMKEISESKEVIEKYLVL